MESCLIVIAGLYISSAGRYYCYRHNLELVSMLNFCNRLCLLFSPAQDCGCAVAGGPCFYGAMDASSAVSSSMFNPSYLGLLEESALSDFSSDSDS